MLIDLNCDLGEREPRQRTAALLRYVTSANIACGGHAGDIESMRFAVTTALASGVRVGAHPGLFDRENFGRNPQTLDALTFKTALLLQVSGLETLVRAAGGKLHHIKLHGALYHMTEERPALRRALVELLLEFWPRTTLYALAGGRVVADARKAGITAWDEGFLDRGYGRGGQLVPRGKSGALVPLTEIKDRVASIRQTGGFTSVRRSLRISVHAQTWCIHADGKHALQVAQTVRNQFP